MSHHSDTRQIPRENAVGRGNCSAGRIISPQNRDFHSLWDKLLIAFFAAGPVMFALAMFAVWLRQGRWRQVVIWLALVLLASLVTMAVTLFVIEPDRTAALQPGEQLDAGFVAAASQRNGWLPVREQPIN
jgi:hypothetical protein